MPTRLTELTEATVVADSDLLYAVVGGDSRRVQKSNLFGGRSYINLGTAVTASTTAVDFTGIPAWARRITVMFSGVSTNGASRIIAQLGDAGGIENSGYAGSCIQVVDAAASNGALNTNGFIIAAAVASTVILHGHFDLVLMEPLRWSCSGNMARSDGAVVNVLSGVKVLSDTLDRLRITTAGGTDTFDAGIINISWE